MNRRRRGNGEGGRTLARWGLAGALALGVCVAAVPAQAPARYDLLLRGGHVVDGTGSPWVLADVGIIGDTIAAIAPRLDGPASRVIDASGLVVAPGFIDIHTHARRGIFDVPTADNYTRQGVTTLYEGQDGSSPLPIRGFLDRVATTRISPNFGTFIGQGSVRESVIGLIDRRATPDEVERMRAVVRQGMRDGAVGLSTGLFYVPGVFTPTEEVVELAKVAGTMGGIHVSHMRNEAAQVLDSVRETIAIGEQGGLPTQVTHHKIIGVRNWGRSEDTLRLIEEARARGIDVTIDQYPYTASATSLSALFPPWALEGGQAAVVQRLRDPGQRAKIRTAVADNIRFDRGGGDPKNIGVSACDWNVSLAGKDLAQIARERGLGTTVEDGADAALWIVENGGASGIFHAIGEADLERILLCPVTMIASDGEIPIFGKASPHPRSYGTFARVLAVYVHDRRLLRLEEAVRKMTSLPAWRLHLWDRGILRPGMKADVAVFDADRVRDKATYEQPHQYADGFTHVIVNGQVVYEHGAMTAARPGRVLYGPAKQ